jgi:hypothetical protein
MSQDAKTCDARFSEQVTSIRAVLVADWTLNVSGDWVEAEAPEPVALPVDDGASFKAAVVPVILHYSTTDALA